MTAIEDVGRGVVSVVSVISSSTRSILGESKVRRLDRLAAETGWFRSTRKLQSAAPTCPVPPITRTEGRWRNPSSVASTRFDSLIDSDVSNPLFGPEGHGTAD